MIRFFVLLISKMLWLCCITIARSFSEVCVFVSELNNSNIQTMSASWYELPSGTIGDVLLDEEIPYSVYTKIEKFSRHSNLHEIFVMTVVILH